MLRIFTFFFLAATSFAQSVDSALTQTLIGEIRALRQELETTNITAQRVQITLYRLQSQTAIVTTAQQRLDTARIRLTETQREHTRVTAQAKALEQATSGPIDSNEKAAMQQELPHIKTLLETLATEEAVRQSAMVEAESQYRSEQARLADLQGLLDRLDRALDELARPKH